MPMWESTLIISYSWWGVIPVFFASLLLSGLLYFRNQNNKLSKTLTGFLFVVRFLSLTLLGFLLLSPFIRYNDRVLTRPVVVVGIDNSESMIVSSDSGFLKNGFETKLAQVISELSDFADVQPFLFDQTITAGSNPDFSGYRSDYGAFLNFFKKSWSESSADYLVLVGDGLYNSGLSPDYIAEKITTPIVVIATGDTVKKSDVAIKEVRFNKTVFIDDVSPLEITVEASELINKSLNLKVIGFGKTLANKELNVSSDRYATTLTIPVQLISPGKQRIEVVVDALREETILANNSFVLYLDVVKTKKKILILGLSPHPDISAIKQSLQKVKSYDVTVGFTNDFKKNTTEFDLVVLHQLPGEDATSYAVINQLNSTKTPILFILGRQTNIASFNLTYPGVNLVSASRQPAYATNRLNPQFNLFRFGEEEAELFNQFPPLNVLLASYQTNPTSKTFSFQSIDKFDTDFPLINFYQSPDKKLAAIFGDGLWRWRMDNYLKRGNYEVFDDFLRKSIQYLLTANERKRFEVEAEESYATNEPVIIRAMYYNASFEPVNTNEIPLQITNADGDQFEYLFSREGEGYSIQISGLSEGVYHYISGISDEERRFIEEGEFVVSNQSKELQSNQANHRLLYHLSSKNKGAFLYLNEFEKLTELLTPDNLKSKVHFEQELIELGSLPFYLVVVLLLLTLEWFLRKYYGTY